MMPCCRTLLAALALAGCAGGPLPPPAATLTRPLPLAELPALVNYWQAGDAAPVDTGSLGGAATGGDPVRWDTRAAERWAMSHGPAFLAPDGSFEVALRPGMRRGPEHEAAQGYQVTFDLTESQGYCRYESVPVATGERRVDNGFLMSLLIASRRADFADLELFYVGLSEVDGESIHVMLAGFGNAIQAESLHAVGDRMFHSTCTVDSTWARRQQAGNALPSLLGDLVVAATAVRFPIPSSGQSIRI